MSLFRRFTNYAMQGMAGSVGMNPVRRAGSETVFEFLGGTFQIGRESGMKVLAQRDMTKGDMFDAALNSGMLLFSAGTGYMTGGIPGLIGGIAFDVGFNAANIKYNYKAGPNHAGLKWAGWGHQFSTSTKLATWGRTGAMMAAGVAASSVFGGGFMGALPMMAAPALAGSPMGSKVTAGLGLASVGAFGAYHGARMAGNAIGATLKAGRQYQHRRRGIDTSGSMAAFHTQGAFTMRERAVQAIHKSHLNARSALGQEAQFMHMPMKNYHSLYR